MPSNKIQQDKCQITNKDDDGVYKTCVNSKKNDPKENRKLDLDEIIREVDSLIENTTQEAVSFVINEVPKKIKAIDSILREINWYEICSLETDTSWFELFAKKNFDGKEKYRSFLMEQKTRLKGPCTIMNSAKPFLFDSYYELIDEQKKIQKPQDDLNEKSNMIPTNRSVHRIYDLLKPFLMELISIAPKILLALEALSPPVQDGHNFGVHVQSKAMETVGCIFSTSVEQLGALKSYYISRKNTLFHSMIQCPQIQDSQQEINEMDRDQLYSLFLSITNVYNSYTEIHDFVVKNFDRLLQPRG